MPAGRRAANFNFERWFWGNFDHQPNGCMIWKGRPNSAGYGPVTYNGRVLSHHVVAYILTYGPIPPGRHVCHKCPDEDVKLCGNPRHLYAGTSKQNAEDSVTKGQRPTKANGRHGWTTKPESKPTGDKSGPRKYPDRYPKGDDHWTRKDPERAGRLLNERKTMAIAEGRYRRRGVS